MLARIRKALAAGVGAGIGAAGGVIGKAAAEGALDDTTWQQALGAFIVGAAAVGWTTWRVPNKEGV